MQRIFTIKSLKKSVNKIDYELEYISLADTCCAIYKNSNSEILMVKQYRPVIEEYSIEIPGGSKRRNESLEEAARREFQEETGLNPISIEPLISFYLSVGTSDEKVHIFSVTEVESEKPLFSGERAVIPFWLEYHKCISMINNGKIDDAKTIIALKSISNS